MPGRCILYYITDRRQFPGNEKQCRRALLSKIEEGACAGVDYIQLREKDLNTRDLEELARVCVALLKELRTANRELRTCFLVNSRTDIAAAAGADGVHLRSDDISTSDVRGIWSSCLASDPNREPLPAIAKSCHNTSDLLRAKSEGADFVVFAPVFEKKDFLEVRPRGLAALREACAVKLPVLALGGVTLQNAGACLDAGAAGIAGIRLFQENRIDDVVRRLRG